MSSSAQAAQVLSATPITVGTWYHVAAVRGSNFLQIYVNGVLERQTNVAFAQDYGTLPLFFGTSGQSFWDHKLRGNLDEISLYNRALSSNEVAAIFAAGTSAKCKAVNLVTQPTNQTRRRRIKCFVLRCCHRFGAAELPMALQWNEYRRGDQQHAQPEQCPARQCGEL